MIRNVQSSHHCELTAITGSKKMSAQLAAVDVIEEMSPHESAASLLARARSLRTQAKHVNPVLAEAYLRRAAELSLEAWVRAVRSAPVEIDDVVSSAAA
jgi:hypothetical protein